MKYLTAYHSVELSPLDKESGTNWGFIEHHIFNGSYIYIFFNNSNILTSMQLVNIANVKWFFFTLFSFKTCVSL